MSTNLYIISYRCKNRTGRLTACDRDWNVPSRILDDRNRAQTDELTNELIDKESKDKCMAGLRNRDFLLRLLDRSKLGIWTSHGSYVSSSFKTETRPSEETYYSKPAHNQYALRSNRIQAQTFFFNSCENHFESFNFNIGILLQSNERLKPFRRATTKFAIDAFTTRKHIPEARY